jgi:hypothetical protein
LCGLIVLVGVQAERDGAALLRPRDYELQQPASDTLAAEGRGDEQVL